MLFAGLTLYNLRVIERLWGSRKFASFLLTVVPLTLILAPIITISLRYLTLGKVNYIPAGPTSIIFALLAQYHATIPFEYRYKLVLPVWGLQETITVSSKSSSYLIPAQLALSQFPSSLIPAGTGWLVGYGYRYFTRAKLADIKQTRQT
jgi:hypothetical protein